ncbi:MAG: beta-propeller domain-containing protein [Clostridiales bacterium]|nr:beta-propeller domain-containing protein [Clostridiales bacterium]
MLKKVMVIFALAAVVIAAVTVFAATDKLNETRTEKDSREESWRMPVNGSQRSVALYIKSPLALVNGKTITIDEDAAVIPVIENDRAFAPLRFVSESFGAEVEWDDATKTVTAREGGKTVRMSADKDVIEVDGDILATDARVKIINDRVFAPLRAFADAFGKKTFYDRGLIIISDDEEFDAVRDKEIINGFIKKLNNLPTVGSADKFAELALEYVSVGRNHILFKGSIMDEGVAFESSEEAPMAASAAGDVATSDSLVQGEADAESQDYSTTNTQVDGVDEADVIKTDGQYIYYVNSESSKNKIQVARAVPAEDMVVEFTAEYNVENFMPQEIFIDGDYMAAIGSSTVQSDAPANGEIALDDVVTGAANAKRMAFYPEYEAYTHVIVYNVADKNNVVIERTMDISGYYVSSRRIGDNVYIVTNRNYYSLIRGDNEFFAPRYKDSSVSTEYIDVKYDDMRYFPKNMGDGVMTVAGFNLRDSGADAKISTFAGGGGQIYVSKENLYVTATDFSGTTDIYKFALYDGEAIYQHEAKVSGSPVNQFSMDESEGFFRIATTEYDENGVESNNLFILTPTLDQAGSITGIAEGERIYSARFMGGRAYMVTFKLTDPLFTIDVSDPYAPKILGELKIPGYSEYLHPYDETRVLGFGKDTFERDGQAFYKGMKMSLFDVSDVAAPRELFTEYIGDRGTNSELLQNHKALLFDKKRGLLAFPVDLLESRGASELEWGEFTFQGAFVYSIDTEKGFELKGRVTHITPGVQNLYEDYERFVRRAIMIGDVLYTVSAGEIVATDISSMMEKGSVSL